MAYKVTLLGRGTQESLNELARGGITEQTCQVLKEVPGSRNEGKEVNTQLICVGDSLQGVSNMLEGSGLANFTVEHLPSDGEKGY